MYVAADARTLSEQPPPDTSQALGAGRGGVDKLEIFRRQHRRCQHNRKNKVQDDLAIVSQEQLQRTRHRRNCHGAKPLLMMLLLLLLLQLLKLLLNLCWC